LSYILHKLLLLVILDLSVDAIYAVLLYVVLTFQNLAVCIEWNVIM